MKSFPNFRFIRAMVRFFVLPSGDPIVSPDAEHGELQKEADLFGDVIIHVHCPHLF
jgi:hypothetical protein